ncbi:MAG TPA: pantoate--beta-alanine ligase [Streptosporangiaceae bacterium]|nr:pantoate--beta-alanine ligase [Streptosporangiaceae bacterium]
MMPILARTRLGLATARATMPRPVVLVPTMGALHDGHRSLIRRARELAAAAPGGQPGQGTGAQQGQGGSVLVSIFVNPLQFGAGEDFGRYPRTIEQDLEICAQEGAAVVFAPAGREIYPAEPQVTVDPGPVGRLLEGEFRPGFFGGVLTVVLKLLHLTAPDIAVFGEKDAQQLALIRHMVADLDLPVQIAAAPTRRDPDGLAISSRNVYLSDWERAAALALPRALAAASAAVSAGPKAALAAAALLLDAAGASEPPVELDYLTLADPVTFAEVGPDHTGPALLLVAARVGTTRLIDNCWLTFGDEPPGQRQ